MLISIKLLKTRTEILTNTIFRFLHLRSYTDDKHALTPWGKVLAAMVSEPEVSSEHEEAAILATELIRLDLLNANNMFPMYSGAPIRGSGM